MKQKKLCCLLICLLLFTPLLIAEQTTEAILKPHSLLQRVNNTRTTSTFLIFARYKQPNNQELLVPSAQTTTQSGLLVPSSFSEAQTTQSVTIKHTH